MDVNISSSITENSQTELSSQTSTPQENDGTTKSTAAVGVAIVIGAFTNIDKTTIQGTESGGASIDANDAVTVGRERHLPVPSGQSRSRRSTRSSTSGRRVSTATPSSRTDSSASRSTLFNTEVLTSGSQAKVGAGGSFALLFYNDTSTADVQNKVKINQNTSSRFRESGSQSVAVQAETSRCRRSAWWAWGALGLNLAGGVKSAMDLKSAPVGSAQRLHSE